MIKRCLVCGNEIHGDSPVCCSCSDALDRECIDSMLKRCPLCYYPVFSSEYECRWCKREGSFPVYSIASYSGPFTNDVLQQFKFQGNREISKVVALYMERGLEFLDPEKSCVIVPVPCSEKSLKKRGWDQMDEVCSHFDRQVVHLIVNIRRDSSQQKRLSRIQRLASVKGKYCIDSSFDCSSLENRRIVLVDDIMTTGSTLRECRNLLLEAGFSDVVALTWLNEFFSSHSII